MGDCAIRLHLLPLLQTHNAFLSDAMQLLLLPGAQFRGVDNVRSSGIWISMFIILCAAPSADAIVVFGHQAAAACSCAASVACISIWMLHAWFGRVDGRISCALFAAVCFLFPASMQLQHCMPVQPSTRLCPILLPAYSSPGRDGPPHRDSDVGRDGVVFYGAAARWRKQNAGQEQAASLLRLSPPASSMRFSGTVGGGTSRLQRAVRDATTLKPAFGLRCV